MNTATIETFHIFNYFTIWLLFWFILYILKIINNNPYLIYILMIYPTLIMLYEYLKYNNDNLRKKIIIISTSIITHYGPLIYLIHKNKKDYD